MACKVPLTLILGLEKQASIVVVLGLWLPANDERSLRLRLRLGLAEDVLVRVLTALLVLREDASRIVCVRCVLSGIWFVCVEQVREVNVPRTVSLVILPCWPRPEEWRLPLTAVIQPKRRSGLSI